MPKINPLDQFLHELSSTSPFKVFVHDEDDALNLPKKILDKKLPVLISILVPKGKAIILDERGFTFKFDEKQELRS